jgi:hypothetical protein
MSAIFIGYGEYRGYRLTEIPQQLLDELALRFPLRVKTGSRDEFTELLVTVAIHEEVGRRVSGGKQELRLPSLRDCANDILTRGYQQASKIHHPDGKGHHGAQLRLNRARDELRKAVENLPDDIDERHDTVIPAPGQPLLGHLDGIGDDDVPF